MKLKGIDLKAAARLRRTSLMGANLSTRIAHTELSKKSAKKDRKNWRNKMYREE